MKIGLLFYLFFCLWAAVASKIFFDTVPIIVSIPKEKTDNFRALRVTFTCGDNYVFSFKRKDSELTKESNPEKSDLDCEEAKLVIAFSSASSKQTIEISVKSPLKKWINKKNQIFINPFDFLEECRVELDPMVLSSPFKPSVVSIQIRSKDNNLIKPVFFDFDSENPKRRAILYLDKRDKEKINKKGLLIEIKSTDGKNEKTAEKELSAWQSEIKITAKDAKLD